MRAEVAVGRLLTARGETLVLAESCTGGMAAERVTRVPGSSVYFLAALVTYADEAKRRFLGVSAKLLREKGAVSRECAEAMARGARRQTGADWAVSVTGIAGPGGGTKTKPVGTVYIGLAGPSGVVARKYRFTGGRAEIRRRSATRALETLLRGLGGEAGS